MNHFFEILQNPSLFIKEQSPRRKFEIKGCLVFFKNSQKWSKRFLLCTRKTNFWGGFSLVFAFKQANEQVLFQVQLLKMLKKNIVFVHFRVTVQIF